MRELAFFERKEDYEAFVREEMFSEPLIRNHPFYRNLIQWVMDHRAPLFYRLSDPSEHYAFSGAYHFMTRRNSYDSAAHESLFFLHDFTHLLFPYPHSVEEVTRQEFIDAFTYQERLASSETEIMAHYRIPQLRGRVFADRRIFFDVMLERGLPKPDPLSMLALRNRLVLEDGFGEQLLPADPEMLRWFRSWRRLTPKWAGERYDYMRQLDMPSFDYLRLDASNYEQQIAAYRSQSTQASYERMMLRTLQLGFALMGWDDAPLSWQEAAQAAARLEGQVFFQPLTAAVA